MKALILAPFDSSALQRLRKGLEVICESWMDTRRLLAPEELVERIQRHDLQIVVVPYMHYTFTETFVVQSMPFWFFG